MKKEKKFLSLLTVMFVASLFMFLLVRYTELFGFAVINDVVVSRTLPSESSIDQETPVTLDVTVDESNKPNAMIIEETIPDQWEVEYGNYDKKSGNTLSWLLWEGGNKVEDQQIVYYVIPKTQSGVFTGRAITTEEENDVEGDNTLNLGGNTGDNTGSTGGSGNTGGAGPNPQATNPEDTANPVTQETQGTTPQDKLKELTQTKEKAYSITQIILSVLTIVLFVAIVATIIYSKRKTKNS